MPSMLFAGAHSEHSADPSSEQVSRLLADREFVIGRIAEITGRPPAEVSDRLCREERHHGTNVYEAMQRGHVRPYVWTPEMAEFYASTDAFLYESLVWNQRVTKVQIREWMGALFHRQTSRPLRILTFGDGLGIDSLYLALQGHKVTYFEVSQRCIQFAESIFARLGAVVHRIDRPEHIPPAAFDAAICLDVLEHVPHPPEVVALLAAALRPGGLLVAHAPFYLVHRSVGSHLNANRKYSGSVRKLYGPAGLSACDGQFFWNPIVLQKADGTGRSCPMPWRLRIGGLLLAVARWWKMPHVLYCRILQWHELHSLRNVIAPPARPRTAGK